MADSEVKKVKVVDISYNREFKPQGKSFTIHYFNLRAEDGFDTLEGEFSSNAKNQTKFLIGESYEVSITTKTNNRGEYLWFDYSEAEKEKRSASSGSGSGSKGKKEGWTPYVRPRKEICSIIAQSSYEAAISVAAKLPEKKFTHKDIAAIAKVFSEFIIKAAQLDSTACKNEDKKALTEGNNKSIVYQKALKCAVLALDVAQFESANSSVVLLSTQGLITLSEAITQDIITIANGL